VAQQVERVSVGLARQAQAGLDRHRRSELGWCLACFECGITVRWAECNEWLWSKEIMSRWNAQEQDPPIWQGVVREYISKQDR
jgi:hypothetical protein